jgi:hypothetical protein
MAKKMHLKSCSVASFWQAVASPRVFRGCVAEEERLKPGSDGSLWWRTSYRELHLRRSRSFLKGAVISRRPAVAFFKPGVWLFQGRAGGSNILQAGSPVSNALTASPSVIQGGEDVARSTAAGISTGFHAALFTEGLPSSQAISPRVLLPGLKYDIGFLYFALRSGEATGYTLQFVADSLSDSMILWIIGI